MEDSLARLVVKYPKKFVITRDMSRLTLKASHIPASSVIRFSGTVIQGIFT